jgi:hypothetical protein
MKKVLIEKTYATWDELSEERKKEVLENEMNDYSNLQLYYDLKLEDFNYHLEHLKKHYDIEFELKVYDGSRAIKDIVFKNDPFEFRVDTIKIDKYHPYYIEEDLEEYQQKLKQLNDKFLIDIKQLILDYDDLFLDYYNDDYEFFVLENLKADDGDERFLIEEKVIENA